MGQDFLNCGFIANVWCKYDDSWADVCLKTLVNFHIYKSLIHIQIIIERIFYSPLPGIFLFEFLSIFGLYFKAMLWGTFRIIVLENCPRVIKSNDFIYNMAFA